MSTPRIVQPLPSYTPVAFRCTTNCDLNGSMGIGFNHPDGSITRLKLDYESAMKLVGSMSDYLACYRVHPTCQSPICSESPSVDVSIPGEGQSQ